MDDQDKTREQLLEEVQALRQRLAEVEQADEQLSAAEELARREQLYRYAIEAARGVPYARNYLTNRYEHIGSGIKELLGYTPEEFTVEVWTSCVLEVVPFGTIRGLSPEEATRLVREGEGPSWWADVRVRTRTGEERWLCNAAVKVHNAQGNLVGSLGLFQDITDRKRAEESVRTQQAVLENILANIPYSVFWKDKQGIYLGCNERSARDLGLGSPAMVLGRTDYETTVSRAEADFYRQCDREVMESGQPLLNIEETQRRADGSEAALLTSKVPLRDATGDVVGVLGVYTDITDLKHVEETLRRERQRYEDLVNAVDGIVWECDLRSGVALFVSQQAERLLGYSPEEWLADPCFWEDRLYPDDRASVLRTMEEAAMRPGPTVIEYRMIAADGAIIWLRDIVSAVFEGGRGVKLHGIMVDVTGLKRTELLLRESEARYRSVVEGSMQGIGIVQGDTFRYANPRLAQIFGYDGPEDLVGRRWETVVVAEDIPYLRARAAAFLRGESLPSARWQGVRKDGRRIWIESGASRILWQNEPAVLTFSVDVTERAHLEEQLRQALKMEAVGRLAGGVAHDFNNLLTTITGYSEILVNELPPGNVFRGYVLEVRKAADRAAALTRQLLAYSRKSILKPVVLDLNAIVADMENLLRRLIGEDVELTTRLGPGLGRVKADPVQLQQVIMNLVVNARDAMPEGGRLTLETHNVSLPEDAGTVGQTFPSAAGPGQTGMSAPPLGEIVAGRYVLLSVSDTGCGMDEVILAHLFEPFFTTKEVGKGTGLGLATVYGIVKQSGGHVEVQSAVGQGTSFRVYLPRLDRGPEEGADPAGDSPGRGSETILLVEDDETVRTLVRTVLRKNGYTVLEAGDGGEALVVAERHTGPIHLLLTDVVVPQLGGRRLADRLVALRPELRVLFTSGYTDDEVVRRGVFEAETSLLQKPFSPETLARKVREVLDR